MGGKQMGLKTKDKNQKTNFKNQNPEIFTAETLSAQSVFAACVHLFLWCHLRSI